MIPLAPDVPYILARAALHAPDDETCSAGWDALAAKYGHETAAEAWTRAARDLDAVAGA